MQATVCHDWNLLYTPDYCWFKNNVIRFANKQFEAVYTLCVFLLNKLYQMCYY